MLTMVLLPGMDGTGSLFEPFIQALGGAFDVRVVSYPTTGALGYAELEAHARRHLPGDGPFVILGESFSGPIAVSIAASRPVGLAGLVLSSTFVRNPHPAFAFMRHIAGALPVKLAPLPVLAAILLGRFATRDLRSALASAMSRVSAESLRARFRAVLSVDASASLKAVQVPVLYLQASQDLVVPRRSLAHIEAVLPTVQVAIMDAPHFLLQAAPVGAADAVSAFIQRSNERAEPLFKPMHGAAAGECRVSTRSQKS